ncbi:portal protein [Aquamicrobium defluvii]|uniref:Phage P22-like portal protein n=1 Tax=Aquamicrobium defluvii TaxID=69279 RepID=A0A4R6YEA4_9HYPH|nr:portal protein [Aquamicrobium defluvii]TDR34343.1 phage P22-like portal protein [Aquamicrobium defluvii]
MADDILKEAKDAFTEAADAADHNRATAIDDIRFARLNEQWPPNILSQRERDGRPSLTINKLPAFIRQVVNDARMNKPSIKVHPVDSGADPETAEVINGLIRNIEYTSSADVAYDTGVECAVTGGFGYWRVGLDYAFDDTFDMDIMIKRVINPFSIYGDPYSTEADSSDWNTAFVVDRLTKAQFKAQYGNAATVDWDDDAWSTVAEPWRSENEVMVAEWWKRDEVDRTIILFQDIRDGSFQVYSKDQIEKDEDFAAVQQFLEHKQERVTKAIKVTQYIMTGAEVLEKNDWAGRYIPIVPVYGDEFDVQGKRFFRSLIHNAKDAQRTFNYWRSAATELVALAPRVPFIGPKGAFDSDIERWQTANTRSHAFLEYDGQQPPQRQPLDTGSAAGALQEALNASDDMKAIVGMYDASLGARSNETSGRAILARQREGDISTFHFTDNLARAIRHTGRILIDLIPHVYSAERIIRVIGEDGSEDRKQINAPYQVQDPKTGQPMQQPVMGPDGQPMQDEGGNPLMKPIMALHDLTTGKYDLTVSTGPSFTTQREEAASQMTEMIRAFPAAAPIIGPELAKNLDWPGADKIAEKLDQMTSGQVPPQVQQQIEEGKQKLQQLSEENQKLKQDQSDSMAKIEADKQIAAAKIAAEKEIALAKLASEQELERYKAELNAAAVASRPVIQTQRFPEQ